MPRRVIGTRQQTEKKQLKVGRPKGTAKKMGNNSTKKSNEQKETRNTEKNEMKPELTSKAVANNSFSITTSQKPGASKKPLTTTATTATKVKRPMKKAKRSHHKKKPDVKVDESPDTPINLVSPDDQMESDEGGEETPSLAVWDERVEATYRRISAEYNQRLKCYMPEQWARNREKIKAALPRFQLQKQASLAFQVFVTPKQNRFAKEAKVKDINGGVISKLRTITLPEVKPIPHMVSYTLTDRNIAVDDELSLSHIPYIQELDSEEEEAFGSELQLVYEEGIHGTRTGLKKFLNDQMLFQMVMDLTKEHGNEFDRTACFKSIVRHFPNKCTLSKLRSQIWTDVCAALKEGQGVIPTQASVLFPNLDNPHEAEAAQPEKALHSYMSLFCRRCCRYDCFVHSSDNDCSAFGYPKLRPPRLTKHQLAERTPCGHYCHLIKHQLPPPPKLSRYSADDGESVKNGSSSNNSSMSSTHVSMDGPLYLITETESASVAAAVTLSPGKKGANKLLEKGIKSTATSSGNRERQNDVDCDWTAANITVFRSLRNIYGDDYCRIAPLLPRNTDSGGRPTCAQVAERARVEGPLSPTNDAAGGSPLRPSRGGTNRRGRNSHDIHKQFRTMKWNTNAHAGQVHNRTPLRPCNHPGVECSDKSADCPCAIGSGTCMKFCRCSLKCGLRFPGCRCQGGCRTKQCPCYYANWECDADLCRSCGAADFESAQVPCQNVNLQRGKGKQLRLGVSEVAGWGCFVAETVAKNDLISEYCGEVVSQSEAERRGKSYDRQSLSYLFTLNNEYAVDAARKGNKIRFANHSTNPNCYAKVLIVLGDHRIGIYAKRDIQEGEELFFDYEYNTQQKMRFVNVERKRNK